MVHTSGELKQYQSLSLESKIHISASRIKAWIKEYGEDGVYISFSGGKDSTVLMDIIRNQMGYNIPAVFVNVPTQYPELKEFAKTWDNVEFLQPSMSFYDICEKYGFPLISKEVAHKMHDWNSAHAHGKESYVDRQMEERYITKNGKTNQISVERYSFLRKAPFKISHMCCDKLKKEPLKKMENKYKLHPITATMACESALRKQHWIKEGCNAFNNKRPISNPMSFWTEQDVLQYINDYKLPICSVYGNVIEENGKFKTTGRDRTGCILCGFGCQRKDDTRFLQLKETHEKMYSLLDIMQNNGVTFREAIEWINEHGNFNIKL